MPASDFPPTPDEPSPILAAAAADRSTEPLEWTDGELECFLDEALPAEQMAALEQRIRDSDALRRRLQEVLSQREGFGLSVGAVWRKHRLTCPDRGEWGQWLLGMLPAGRADYLRFHLETIGCRPCQANVDDLRAQATPPAEQVVRRRRYFESSVGKLPQVEE